VGQAEANRLRQPAIGQRRAGDGEPRQSGRPPVSAGLAAIIGTVVPLLLAVAWIPIRTRLPNTDLALLLVGSIGAVGVLRHRAGVIAAALSGAVWFVFFDTVPYESWAVSRNPDVETTVILAVVSLIGGEIVLSAGRYRRASEEDEEHLLNVREAAELVASGEELVHVIEATAVRLQRLLGLSQSVFEAEAGDPPRWQVCRNGSLQAPPLAPGATAGAPPALAELPVVVQGEQLGCFVLGFGSLGPPPSDRLLVAVTLADQLGAAFLAQAPPPPPEEPEPRLRLVRRGERPLQTAATRPSQETAGFPSRLERMTS
jgi:hypothetical protein